jgi:hypothetical protein
MYKLPDDFDEQLLADCYLEMISFGAAITKFEFARPQKTSGKSYRVSFVVEGKLSFLTGDKLGIREFSDASSCTPLLKFLLQDVFKVRRIGAASLQILFDGGEYISIEADDTTDFESYSIYLNSGDIVVV